MAQNRDKDQWNRIESRNHSQMFDQLIFSESARVIQWRKGRISVWKEKKKLCIKINLKLIICQSV